MEINEREKKKGVKGWIGHWRESKARLIRVAINSQNKIALERSSSFVHCESLCVDLDKQINLASGTHD